MITSKNPRSLFFVATLTAAMFLASPVGSRGGEPSTASGEVKILTIGNSFADDTTFYLSQFAKSGGKKLLLFGANLGGHSLAQHVGYLKAYEADPTDPKGSPYKGKVDPRTGAKRDFSLRDALSAVPWDYVTIQQVSSQSFLPDSFEPFAGILVSYIHQHAPTAKILVLQTWAYREDHPLLAKEKLTQESMFEGVRAAYNQLAARYTLQIIPVGEAFQAARKLPQWHFQYPDPDFDFANPKPGTLPVEAGSLNKGWSWTKDAKTGKQSFVLDAKHCNTAGKYLAASVLYDVIFPGAEPVTFCPPGLTDGDAAELRRIARETVEKLPAVTP
ncbi:MAG: DUF4886 domain-containing protein [Terrimicrobiaceae bacterium]